MKMLPIEKYQVRVTSLPLSRVRQRRKQTLPVKERIEMAFVSLILFVFPLAIVTGATHVFHLGFAGWLALCLVICFAVITLNIVFNLSITKSEHEDENERDDHAAKYVRKIEHEGNTPNAYEPFKGQSISYPVLSTERGFARERG